MKNVKIKFKVNHMRPIKVYKWAKLTSYMNLYIWMSFTSERQWPCKAVQGVRIFVEGVQLKLCICDSVTHTHTLCQDMTRQTNDKPLGIQCCPQHHQSPKALLLSKEGVLSSDVSQVSLCSPSC